MQLLPVALLGMGLLGACGHAAPPVPDRRVLDRDLGNYVYRRFQKVEDIEFPVQGNPGIGYTAVYQLRSTVGDRAVPRSALAVAFVTEYERPAGLAEALPTRLGKLDGYEKKTVKVSGQKVMLLVGAGGDAWAVWPSSRYLVKVGGPEAREAPPGVLEAYLDQYPSDLK
jgi:hypothetical protein